MRLREEDIDTLNAGLKLVVATTTVEAYKRATPSALLCHERGHCNGWKHPY